MPSGSMNGCEANVVYPAARINCPPAPSVTRHGGSARPCARPCSAGIIAARLATSTPLRNSTVALVQRALAALAVAFGALHVADCTAQAVPSPSSNAVQPAAGRQLLNSERIEQRFGSYGVEVLAGDPRIRVSNLYSEGGGQRTCRTFAAVVYPAAIDPAIAAEHAEIVRGGSIGAVFAAHGWQVVKINLRYVEIDAPERVARLMRIAAGTRLAAHAYELDVAKAGRSIEYALLVEIHHPDYLSLGDLRSIYGTADATGREHALDDLLATALAAARGP
jgi:hypothetical protein